MCYESKGRDIVFAEQTLFAILQQMLDIENNLPEPIDFATMCDIKLIQST